jgi:hypothetical protein
MQLLLRSQTLTLAAIAAAVTALASWPRMAMWADRPAGVGFCVFAIWWTACFLWGFVFAWHEEETHRPLFQYRWPAKVAAGTVLGGIAVGLVAHFWFDPAVRQYTPEAFPHGRVEWVAMLLFAIFFEQLFVCYAAFSVLVRLSHRIRVAFTIAICLGIFVFWYKVTSLPSVPPASMIVAMLFGRILIQSATLYLYVRGGFLLASLWTFILYLRYLPG